MQTLQYLGPQKLIVTHLPKPKIKSHEVLLKIKSVGICGTDLHIYKGGMNVPIPLTQGHEFAGVIEKVGKSVTQWKVGDRVTGEHVIPCGKCEYCLKGKPNLCQHAQVIGLTLPGAMAEYLAIPADLLYKLPPKMSFEEGALIEPLSIALYAIKGAGQLLGKKVGVVGQGPIGMLIDQALKAAGATVIGIDVLDFRLQFVKKKKWVDKVIKGTNQRALEKIKNSLDISFEVVGKEVTAQTCLNITRRNGKIFLIGVFEKPAQLNLMQVVKKELKLFGSWTCAFTFPEAINLVAEKKIDLKGLITHRSTLAKAPQAFAQASQYAGQRLKTVINIK